MPDDDVMTMPLRDLATKGMELAGQGVPAHSGLRARAADEIAQGNVMVSVLQARATLEAAEVNRQLVDDNKWLVRATWVLAGMTAILAIVTAFAV